VLSHQLGLLKNGRKTTREWTAIFEDMLTKNKLEESELELELHSVDKESTYWAAQEAQSLSIEILSSGWQLKT
jgi:hypothetical protein